MDASSASGRLTSGRYTFLLGILPAAALCTGCAQGPARSLARAWNDLPRVSWSPLRSAADAESDDGVKIADDSSSDAASGESSLGNSLTGRFRFSAWSNEASKDQKNDESSSVVAKGHSGPRDPFLDDDADRAHATSDDLTAQDGEIADVPKVSSQRDRLRAALSDDSRRNHEPEIDVAEQERLRLRIEALMIRATKCFEQDELDKAQRDAELAQRLANKCSLEFSPDEDRPVDLLARIVAREQSLVAEEEMDDQAEPATDSDPLDVAIFSNDFPDNSTEFDPYSDRRLPPQSLRRTPIPDSTIVVLESPSFEDADSNDPAVSPTAYADNAGSSQSALELPGQQPQDDISLQNVNQAMQASEFSRIESATSVPVMGAPSPPLEGPSFGDADLLPENSFAAAPVPSADRVAPPKRGTVTLEDIDGDANSHGEDDAEILAAAAVPRWLVLACLSALATAVSIWLIRRRSLASF